MDCMHPDNVLTVYLIYRYEKELAEQNLMINRDHLFSLKGQ